MESPGRADKTEEQKYVLRTPAHGRGQLRVGNPGNKNKGGRPSNRFKKWCQRQLDHPNMKRAVRKAMRRAARTGKLFDVMPVVNLMAKYGHHELTKDKDMNLNAGKDLLAAINEALSE